MLDTRLKNTRKLKISLIVLAILLPALILVGLYPQMEKAAVAQKEVLETLYEQQEMEFGNEVYQREIRENFVYMSTEAAYYVYAGLLREAAESKTDLSIFHEYGWDDDYYTMRNETSYIGIWNNGDETHVATNADWDMSQILTLSDDEALELLNEHMLSPAGFLKLEFNKYGELEDAHMATKESVLMPYDCDRLILESMEQYENNAEFWQSYVNESTDTDEFIPKNFTIIFVLEDTSSFCEEIYEDSYTVYISWTGLYADIGAYWVVLVMAALVALAALLLPFIKRLDTGWERVLSVPFEVSIALIIAGISGAYGMFVLMSHTTKTFILESSEGVNEAIQIIGISMSPDTLYVLLLILNAIGWTVLFFAEYIVVSSFRQFVCQPVHYLKERVWMLRLAAWVKKQIGSCFNAALHTPLSGRIHRLFFGIALVNGLAMLVGLLIVSEAGEIGILGLILYSVFIYLLLLTYGKKVQAWYKNLLASTHEMTEGNLKVSMDKDFGMFQEMGDELSCIQSGFSKAVAEEARSQNMKTELITNVSHDLKTPLTAMITYIDLMKKEDLSEEDRKSYLTIIDQKAQRLKVLIEDLFEVSKATTGNIEMNRMDIDVVNLMKEVRLEMEEKIVQSDLDFRWGLPEEKIILYLDGQRTYRVFENLLNNAIKYSMPKSRVYVDMMNGDTQVCITFKNMSAEEINTNPMDLTERFVRGDASRKTEGSGLGLAIAKSFVELQDGHLDITVDGDLFKVTIVWKK